MVDRTELDAAVLDAIGYGVRNYDQIANHMFARTSLWCDHGGDDRHEELTDSLARLQGGRQDLAYAGVVGAQRRPGAGASRLL